MASSAHAENLRGRFLLVDGISIEQLIPVATEAAYECEAPSTPAQIVFSKILRPLDFDPTPFFQSSIRNQVTIRRSGQVEEGQSNGGFQASLLDRRPEIVRRAEATDVSLNMTLSLCAYGSLLDFVEAEYTLAGQIGNFRVDHHKTVGPGTESGLSISYTGRNWTSHDGGQFLQIPLFRHRTPNSIGIINLRLSIPGLPFQQIDGDAELLLDINTSHTFSNMIVVDAMDARQ